jgi:hypothetical protein
MWERDMVASPQAVADNRFTRTVTLDWAEIRDDYVSALRKISVPLFNLVPIIGSASAGDWFTRTRIQQMFTNLYPQLRLFD